MKKRIDLLRNLVGFESNLDNIKEDLAVYSWDSEQPLLNMSKADFSKILDLSISNKISLDDLVHWANLIENREDLGFETEELQEFIFELANPEINGDITKERLMKMLELISLK